MKKIELNGETVAMFHKPSEWKEGLDFLTNDDTYVQAGTWWYQTGKELKPHRHKINPRQLMRTQETIILESGKLCVNLYDQDNNIFHKEILEKGDIGIILTVGHGYTILEDDTKVLEVKPGPFNSVEEDKDMITA